MLKNIKTKSTLLTSAGMLITTATVKIVELIKNVISASRFGLTYQADVYNVILSIPEVFATVIGMDSMRGATMTYFTDCVTKKDHESIKNLLSAFVTWGVIVATILAVITIIEMRHIVEFIANGFSQDKINLSIKIGYVVIPVLFIRVISGVFISALNAYNIFVKITLLPLCISVLGIVVLILTKDNNLLFNMSMAYTAGYILYGITLLTMARQYIPWKIQFGNIPPVFWEILRFASAQIICMGITQLAVFVEKRTVSFYPGGVASLNIAYTLAGQFVFIVVFSVFGVMQRELTEKISQGSHKQAIIIYWRMLSYILFIVVFCATCFAVLRHPIIEMLYQRHSFNSNDVDATAKPFLIYCGWIIGATIMLTTTTLILATKNWKILIVSTSIAYGLEIIFVGYFGRWFGYTGVALATTLTIFLYTVLLMLGVRRLFGRIFFGNYSPVIKILITGILTACMMYASYSLMVNNMQYNILHYSYIQVTIVSLIGALLYYILSKIFGIDYASNIFKQVIYRFQH